MTWQYIAGYYDGEGCLLLGVVQEKRELKKRGSVVDGWNILPSLQLQSYDYGVLRDIKKYLEDHGIKVCTPDIKTKRHNQTKDAMRLAIMGWDNMLEVIKYITPYSISKKRQLELFGDLNNLKQRFTKTNNHKGWTKELFIEAMDIVDEINSLKGGLRGKMNAKYFKDLWKQ